MHRIVLHQCKLGRLGRQRAAGRFIRVEESIGRALPIQLQRRSGKGAAVAGGARGKNGSANSVRWASGEGGRAGRVPAISAPAFTGRQEELAALGRALASPPAVILVEGETG